MELLNIHQENVHTKWVE